MRNRHGLDVDYFTIKLEGLLGKIRDYNPDQLAKELGELSKTARKRRGEKNEKNEHSPGPRF